MEDKISYDDLIDYCRKLIDDLGLEAEKPDVIYGIARGGIIPATIISEILDVNMLPIIRKKEIVFEGPIKKEGVKNILIVDDQCQSGESFQKSLEDITNLYGNDVNIKTAIIIFVNTSRFKVDFYSAELTYQDKLELPWDWDSPIGEESDIIQKAIDNYNTAKDKIDRVDVGGKYIPLDDNIKHFILEIKDRILSEELSDFIKLKGIIDGAPTIIEFKRKTRIGSKKSKIEIMRESSQNGSVSMDLSVDTLKDLIFRFDLKEKDEGYLEFKMDTSKNRFSRCEEKREEPHPFCKDNCKLKEHDSMKNVICASFVNGILSMLKIEHLSDHRLIFAEVYIIEPE